MMSNTRTEDPFREISLILTDIRHSLDRAYPLRRGSDEEREALKVAFLKFEAQRFDFSPDYRSTARNTLRRGTNDLTVLRDRLIDLVRDDAFARVAREVPFRKLTSPTRLVEFESIFRSDRLSVLEAVSALADVADLVQARFNKSADLFEQPISSIRKVLPQQKLAPVKFDVRDGVLVLSQNNSQPGKEDVAIAQSAHDELMRSGNIVIDELKRSNCDKRLISSIEYLHGLLVGNGGPIQIGLSNIGCEAMASTFKDELPNAVVSMLHTYNVGISMYVGQFPEWGKFLENAAYANIQEDQAAQISATANKLVKRLEQEEKVDPNVSATISYLNSLINSPKGFSKRAVFAVLRTIENLLIKMLSYSADFIDKSLQKTIDGLSSTVARVAVISFLGIALAAANGLLPVSSAIREVGWVRNAIEIVERQLANAKD